MHSRKLTKSRSFASSDGEDALDEGEDAIDGLDEGEEPEDEFWKDIN